MPLLCFQPLDSHRMQTMGPAPYFRLEGGSIRQGPHDHEVATFSDGYWITPTGSCITIWADAPVTVHFEHNGEPCEDAPSVRCDVQLVDGSIRHGAGGQHLLARLDHDDWSWHVYPGRSRCSSAILKDQ